MKDGLEKNGAHLHPERLWAPAKNKEKEKSPLLRLAALFTGLIAFSEGAIPTVSVQNEINRTDDRP